MSARYWAVLRKLFVDTGLYENFPCFSLSNSFLNLLKRFRYTLCTCIGCLENVSKQSTKKKKPKTRGYFHVNFDTVEVKITL